MRRIVIGLMTVALAACGTNTASPDSSTPGPDNTLWPSTTSTMVESPTTSVAPVAATTVSATPSTTVPVGTTTTATPQRAGPAVTAPYFYVDEQGHPNRTGPFLLPVAREVGPTVAVARVAIDQLLGGPTKAERASVPAISSAIPAGARLLGLTIDSGTATIDLSRQFEGDDDSAVVALRIAQVVFTLTRFDTVDRVVFYQEGRPIAVQTGDGRLVDGPVDRGDYLEFAATLSVERPLYGGMGANPLRVTGFGAVFEAVFRYALTDDDGRIIEEGQAMTDLGTGWGEFDFTIHYEVDRRQVGALVLWANSAKDGSQIDVREYPVVLIP